MIVFLGLLCAFALFGQSIAPRQVKISGKVQKVADLTIVVEKEIPLLKFAAKELQNFLQQATGKKIAIKNAPAAKGISLILGDCLLARKAGMDVKKLPPEGFYILRKGNHVYLAGQDHPTRSPEGNNWQQTYLRGSLSAAYDFLERFASVRFYFPGPCGTIVPVKGALFLPETIQIMDRPDMCFRNYSTHKTKYYPTYPDYTRKDNKPSGDTLTRVRLRFSEFMPPGGHGLNRLEYLRRFGRSHPEYFALMENGKRYNDPNQPQRGQLCYNSPLREIIYQDVKACLTGKDARTRDLPSWHYNFSRRDYVSIGPQDWYYMCCCEKCSRIAPGGRGAIYKNRAARQAVSNFMWNFYVEVANRLTREGIKGKLKQSIYPPCDLIPDVEIPSNIRIQACINGKGGDKSDTAFLKKWYEKLGKRKMDLWTYCIGKHLSKKIPGIIPMYPRNIVRFMDDNGKYINGAYYESESDYFLFQYLNYYVFAKKAWNNALTADEILSEHHQVMFGKGAPFMAKFYEDLEYKWGQQILGNTVDTGLGPTSKVPQDYEIWNRIFSPAVIRGYEILFEKALSAAAGDKGAVARITFIREHFFGPLKKTAAQYTAGRSALASWSVAVPGTVYLRATRGDAAEVATKVTIRKDAVNFYFTFECEEPRMKDLKAVYTQRDHAKLYEDSCVEIMLNPSGDRKNYFQFIVNSNGVLTDYRWTAGGKADRSWNSSAKAGVTRGPSSWTAVITVPVKDLGKVVKDSFPVNFCRERNLVGPKEKKRINGYHWSPLSNIRGGFHAIENWGTLRWRGEKAADKVFKMDFSASKLPYCWLSGGKKGGQTYGVDKKIFISGPQSLRMENVPGKAMGMSFRLKNLKPNTRYRVCAMIRTADLRPFNGSGSAYVSVRIPGMKKSPVLPRGGVTGTTLWHQVSGEFVTPAALDPAGKSFISCSVRRAGGVAYFDDLSIEEVK